MPVPTPRPFNILLLAAILATQPALGAVVDASLTPPETVRQIVTQFLADQAAAAGAVAARMSVAPLDARLRLASCAHPVAEFAPGAKLWGHTTVAVSCASPHWRIYVPAVTGVDLAYPVAAATLGAGHVVVAADIVTSHGDLAHLPADAITDAARITGHALAGTLLSGSVFRAGDFARERVITAGQKVRVLARGAGFAVSVEALATSSASTGQSAQAIAPDGRRLSGIARNDGVLEVSWQ